MRVANRMTEKRLKALTADASCGVVPGLYVSVRRLKDGSYAKYFLLRERSLKRVFTLGKFPEMTLAEAFEKGRLWKKKIAEGIDPAKEEKAAMEALRPADPGKEENVLTFEKLIWKWIEFNEKRGRWKNANKSRDQVWTGFFRNHIPQEIRDCPVVDLTPQMFCDALGEKWRTMIDTPERILGDAKRAIDWAIRSEMVPPMVNPCQVVDGRLGDLLPLDRPEGGHEPALPPKRMPAFFKALMQLVPVSQTARCLAFAILTSARNSTAREATWGEIRQDDNGQWLHVIPRARMKVKSEKIPFDRKTPLCDEAVQLIRTAPRMGNDSGDYIFPNVNKGHSSPFTRDAVRALIKRMHDKQRKIDGIGWVDPDQFHAKTGKPRIVTLHGLARATFNTWAKDAKGYGHKPFSRDLRESCLDHRNESYQCAYDREQALGDMREVYDAWGKFCYSLLATGDENA
ncbi:integrase family protein [Mesosutterella sp. OilRF-GAM-744-9]|uniref:Integrase family protein n=1 Tax=Mesosutterella porci TaxID=2915351 RepID=A0ABS9MSV5_9BURK|nr:integrase family protein [Mesosutterella sp. oilRF-744-WT-GAM-9]MCG5031706.1 integrase family protein [Mesosutterella sp. oilRF-744-WT-GAM-9]